MLKLHEMALIKLSSVYSYRICMLLSGKKTLTLTMLANELQTTKTNLRLSILELIENDLIEVDRIEGKNKFYKIKR